MPKHGSINLYVHGNLKARQDGQPRTSTSTLTQLLNCECRSFVENPELTNVLLPLHYAVVQNNYSHVCLVHCQRFPPCANFYLVQHSSDSAVVVFYHTEEIVTHCCCCLVSYRGNFKLSLTAVVVLYHTEEIVTQCCCCLVSYRGNCHSLLLLSCIIQRKLSLTAVVVLYHTEEIVTHCCCCLVSYRGNCHKSETERGPERSCRINTQGS